ncbi:hypothetical protein K0817_016780 [Microbacterium sp. HD4P20]|uniref:hypothetical protein n=1 Tax=Microbacterium sp. HD4P20 TaxID=2864874 RepID=UPI001C640354|nr:hypothetical protein [Microbacterium sp. HD4P20]MCP2638210.1 hypothetical protein [Microbacterium sp. HD4P20]
MRYWPSVLLLCGSGVAGAVSIWLFVLANESTGGFMLAGVGLGFLAFVGAAFAVGRLRRIRSLTPEAIIGVQAPSSD